MKEKQLWYYCVLLLCILLSCKEDKQPQPAPDPVDPVLPTPSSTTADKALLDKVQHDTFKYFWEYAHPTSGMARERTGSGDVVTSGGTGFGVQAIVVGVSRGWISREEAVERLNTLTGFLAQADRFHGAWSHWLNGSTGRAIPFSTKDNGGDLVETSFLINGLLTARAYFDGAGAAEVALREKITQLWETVEWDWYASRGDNLLYWHWSPNYGWEMNMPIRGWNEALITYVLALSSPTHAISPEVYQQTWVQPGFGASMNYSGYILRLGPNFGGPLFFAHYSFLGLDPRRMQDSYTNYWLQNVNHTLINRAYSLQSAPAAYGYTESFWGLTASDDPDGYAAHHPGNDNGTVAPTAALSSFPYTPYYSMQALRYFYNSLGPRLEGAYGLKDAHNKARNWTATDHLAIDQGPIVIMIENYRSGLLWNLFTDLPEIQAGLSKANIREPDYEAGFPLAVPDVLKGWVDLLKHPDLDAYSVAVATDNTEPYTLLLLKKDSTFEAEIWKDEAQSVGLHQVAFGKETLPGAYTLRLSNQATTKEINVYLH